eukprot:219140-Pelagomonas_calceolata.AAC.4
MDSCSGPKHSSEWFGSPLVVLQCKLIKVFARASGACQIRAPWLISHEQRGQAIKIGRLLACYLSWPMPGVVSITYEAGAAVVGAKEALSGSRRVLTS